MNRKQLITVYAFITFMAIWGLDLINSIKYKQSISLRNIFHSFIVSEIIYVLATLLLTRWIFQRYYADNKIKLIPGFIFLVAFFISLRYLLEELILPFLFNIRNYNPGTALSFYILDNIYYAIVYIVLGILVFLLDVQFSIQKKQSLLLQKNREAELAFLRSQINPHFLFNSLNNIYALSYKQSENTPEAILRLSELIRFMLYEKKETVPLENEWQYVQSFISLQQLRYDYPLEIVMEATGDLKAVNIPPYLLISFIENACKHGDLSDKNCPLQIRLEVNDGEIDFFIQNKMGSKQKDTTAGIGLENVKRRLDLVYNKAYQLNIQHTKEKFNIHLRINRKNVNTHCRFR